MQVNTGKHRRELFVGDLAVAIFVRFVCARSIVSKGTPESTTSLATHSLYRRQNAPIVLATIGCSCSSVSTVPTIIFSTWNSSSELTNPSLVMS